jgi:hypothetical protein
MGFELQWRGAGFGRAYLKLPAKRETISAGFMAEETEFGNPVQSAGC